MKRVRPVGRFVFLSDTDKIRKTDLVRFPEDDRYNAYSKADQTDWQTVQAGLFGWIGKTIKEFMDGGDMQFNRPEIIRKIK